MAFLREENSGKLKAKKKQKNKRDTKVSLSGNQNHQ